MITQEDIYRQLYPEINHTQDIHDSHMSELITDCIEGVMPEFRWAYIVVLGLAIWVLI